MTHIHENDKSSPEKPHRFNRIRRLFRGSWSDNSRPMISEPYGFCHIASGNPNASMPDLVSVSHPCDRNPVYDGDGIEIGVAKMWEWQAELTLRSQSTAQPPVSQDKA